MKKLSSLISAADLVEHLKKEMLKVEHFVWQKFRDFIEEFLPEEVWQIDELHPEWHTTHEEFLTIKRENLRRCLREAYDARSKFAHTGEPFPAYVASGISGTVSTRGTMEMFALMHSDTKRFVPTFFWYLGTQRFHEGN